MFIMKFSVIRSDISDNLCNLYFVQLNNYCTSIIFFFFLSLSLSLSLLFIYFFTII